jgi:hypothetical protein
VTPRHLRTLRGAAAAWVATVVAATSHTLAGGGAPSPALVGVIGVLAWPVGIALVGRRLSPWRVGSAVLAAQVLFHAAFAMTSGTVPTGTQHTAAAAHAHHAALFTGAATSAAFSFDAPMIAGHILAAALTVVGLYLGERMLQALGRGIRTLFARALAPRAASLDVVRGVLPALPAVSPPGVVLSDLSRRGPPALVAAAF